MNTDESPDLDNLLKERANITKNLAESYQRTQRLVIRHNDYVARAYKRLEWIDAKLEKRAEASVTP